ncbi:[FeFe] hydrogenase H-cluster radical SAM maturase HydE [Shewanella sp. NFH-SH190041]|uniref:[FeFe] hydrogenase H-cluster radical SAM maturase HydE n=1 Tax=Shewanella sp. NFH-SH190041 TaxID=2950245 RepID=UPI0021C341DE|nr:[FeFe] hydrogenase H-cluster radical SAM maturase HydE [Shewanella sp. NFH-SH190041]BDM65374.1 [FeFe] hydrogenase H-cluster radical SAM maturase HydE [Shewanella sp. NFH-SH190041]
MQSFPPNTFAPNTDTLASTYGAAVKPGAIRQVNLFSHSQILALLQGEDDDWLFSRAQLATELEFNQQVYLRGIVEFSNHCRNNCHYCGLRSANRNVERYRLTPEEILRAVDDIAALGMGTVVLQSGDDFHYRPGTVAAIIQEIKRRHGLAITLSLGDRKHEELKLWREAGADRYLLKMETFDRALFQQCRPGADYDERLARLAYIQSLGYQTGSGVITDLPGMTDGILASDLLTLTNMGLDMIACGPFVAHSETPFADYANGDVLKSQRVSAILRLMNPGANIPATSSLDALVPGSREQALLRGCNVIMPSFTPQRVYARYNIYPGKNAAIAAAHERVGQLCHQIKLHGLVPSHARGDSKRNKYVSRY